MKRGKPPLTASEASKLRSLLAQVEALTDLPPAFSQAATGISQRAADAARQSLLITRNALPAHALAAATEVSREVAGILVPNTGALNAVVTGQVGELTADYTNLSRMVRKRLTQELLASVAQGEGVQGLAKRIRGIADRTFQAGQARSVLIARTSLARTYDLSRQGLYDEGHALGLIKGWEWVTNGVNACDVCRTLAGTIFAYDEDTYRHPNCRCSTVPVLMDQKGKVGQRINPVKGTNPDNIHLVTRNGWTTWTLKPADQRVA